MLLGLLAPWLADDCPVSTPGRWATSWSRARLSSASSARSGSPSRKPIRRHQREPARTVEQDPLFSLRLLVDVAVRSLKRAVMDRHAAVQSRRPDCAGYWPGSAGET